MEIPANLPEGIVEMYGFHSSKSFPFSICVKSAFVISTHRWYRLYGDLPSSACHVTKAISGGGVSSLISEVP